MLTIHVWPKRLKAFLLTHPLYKSPDRQDPRPGPATRRDYLLSLTPRSLRRIEIMRDTPFSCCDTP